MEIDELDEVPQGIDGSGQGGQRDKGPNSSPDTKSLSFGTRGEKTAGGRTKGRTVSDLGRKWPDHIERRVMGS